MPFFSFSDNLLQVAYIFFFFKVWIILRYKQCTKLAQFWLRVQSLLSAKAILFNPVCIGRVGVPLDPSAKSTFFAEFFQWNAGHWQSTRRHTHWWKKMLEIYLSVQKLRQRLTVFHVREEWPFNFCLLSNIVHLNFNCCFEWHQINCVQQPICSPYVYWPIG